MPRNMGIWLIVEEIMGKAVRSSNTIKEDLSIHSKVSDFSVIPQSLVYVEGN
jgi:hypothetical protein